jgi:hypothetical protein
MTAEQLFSLCSSLVLPGWLLLLLAPRWRWTQRVAGVAIPVVLASIYLFLIVTHFKRSGGGFGSLAGVRMLFEDPFALLAGWIHYLAFDLFIGAWESRDAIRRHVPMFAVWPCLLLTFLLGPIGLLTYFAIRVTLRGRVELV